MDLQEEAYLRKRKEWFGNNDEQGIYLTKEAPPEARESFKKWAEYQDSLKGRGYNYTLEII